MWPFFVRITWIFLRNDCWNAAPFKCIRLLSVRSSLFPCLKWTMIVSVRSNLPCTNIGMRIELTILVSVPMNCQVIFFPQRRDSKLYTRCCCWCFHVTHFDWDKVFVSATHGIYDCRVSLSQFCIASWMEKCGQKSAKHGGVGDLCGLTGEDVCSAATAGQTGTRRCIPTTLVRVMDLTTHR